MEAIVYTKVTNNLNQDKTFAWINEGLWLAAKQSIDLPYDLFTKAKIDGKADLLEQSIRSGEITIELEIMPEIKVSYRKYIEPKAASFIDSKELAKEAETKVVTIAPEFLRTNDPQPIKAYSISDLLWDKDKAQPKVISEPINLTRIRDEAAKAQ